MFITFHQKWDSRRSKGVIRRYGPYWYAFWRDGQKVRCKYVGKNLSKAQWDAVKNGQASARRVAADIPGQQVLEFEEVTTPAIDGYVPIKLPLHCSRERARKIYYWRCKRRNLSRELQAVYAADFVMECLQRGWKIPATKSITPADAGNGDGRAAESRATAALPVL